jgi:hypothetical protein
MNWVPAVAAAWFALAGLVAVLIGRSIRLADRKAEADAAKAAIAEDSPNFVVDAASQVETDMSVGPVAEGRPAEPRSAAEPARPDVPTARPPEPSSGSDATRGWRSTKRADSAHLGGWMQRGEPGEDGQ